MPSIDAIEAAMREPSRLVPAVGRLGGGALAIDGAGGLWSVPGRSSVIYALRRPDGRILALRVPLADGRAADRYAKPFAAAAVDTALASLRAAGGTLPSLLQVIPDGILIDGGGSRPRGHPVIAAEYLPGGTLGQAARDAAQSGDRAALGRLLASFAGMLARNDAAGFDHGALGPETILLREDGSLAAPNLGAAAWPGSPSALASRPNRDRLPGLLLLAELAALAWNPLLLLAEPDWQHLVLTPEDLARPARSATLASLIAGAGPPAASLAALALEALVSGESPPLAASLDVLRPSATAYRIDASAAEIPPVKPPASPEPANPAAAPAAASQTGSRRLAEIERLNALLLAGDLDASARLWAEAGLADDEDLLFGLDARTRAILERRSRELGAAPEYATLPSRPEALDRLRAALDASDAEQAARLWPRLRLEPAAALLAHRVDSLLSRDLATRAGIAARRNDAAALSAVDREARDLGIALPVETRRAIREARRTQGARGDLAAANRANDHAAIADLARTGALDGPTPLPADLARARDRALAWDALERALQRGDDEAILEAWNRDLLDADPALTQERRARIDLASHRAWWLQSARAALRERDSAAARRLLREIPPGVEARLSPVERRRLDRLARAGAAVTRLEIALQTGPDAAILDALTAVEASGQPLPDALDWAAVRGVADRVSLAAALREAAAALPPDYRRISRLLPAARAAMGAAITGDDAREFAELERGLLRAAAAGRIRDALAAGDPAGIRTAADPDPYGALDLLTTPERELVRQALR